VLSHPCHLSSFFTILLSPAKHLFAFVPPSCSDMTQHYLCLHSIRTQPSTRESCITSPPFPLFSLVDLLCLTLLFSTFFASIYFSPPRCLLHAILCTTAFLIPIPYSLSSSLSPPSFISTSSDDHDLFPYRVNPSSNDTFFDPLLIILSPGSNRPL
jgi:hypothetical protein